ncbi:putative porin [Robertkochia solimangrovi]|uniref:putative porin n=1 Tax=Robertkochia solimangrovi TaxID=2213046 RepID=UPI00117DE154|nr:putative porin [Robertkochia solimangrovi]TRZ43083.1 hypothetical protein DMZ48_10315 [Robertkochia solimangrovi]
MKRIHYLFIVFFAIYMSGYSQEIPEGRVVQDTTLSLRERMAQKPKKEITFAIEDYKIISYDRDTTHFDTTQTIRKEYKFNYMRKDEFELLPFSNAGQTYNRLAVPVKQSSFYPELGAEAKHYNYLKTEDISYYRVPTPTTDVLFRSVMEQGQILDAVLTLNTSERMNLFVGYRGMRSLGKYQHILVSNGNFRMGFDYKTKNDRYRLRGHFTSQDLLNEENGGIAVREQFESGEVEFVDRSRIDVKFENAETFLLGNRLYFDHSYALFKANDSLRNYRISIGHALDYEAKTYEYRQSSSTDYFGDAFQLSNINDKAKFRTLKNQFNLKYESDLLGEIAGEANLYNYNYYFNSVVVTEDGIVQNQLKDTEVSLGGSWKKKVGRFFINARFVQNLVGDMGGTLFDGSAGINLTKDISLEGRYYLSSRMPNFNYLLYQSDYESYNWQNSDVFDKETVNTVGGVLSSKKWGQLEASYSLMDKKAYFGYADTTSEDGDAEVTTAPEDQIIQPFQYSGSINYLKVKFENEFRFGKFALHNTLMYQEVGQSENILNVPQFVTRNTLYFTDHLFKKALFIQTGITFKYFTEYYANGYNPVMSEFFVQDYEKIGGFPLMDFFINAKVRRTRIFFKAEHFNSSFTGYNFYSAPEYPYRDFIIRFGVVWNFFS